MLQTSVSIANLAPALLKAQSEFDPILKDKKNPFYKSKYADLHDCIAGTQDVLLANGLAVSQLPTSDENGGVGVLTILLHKSGEYIAESFTLPLVKKDAQTGVAAVTYARRTAYLGVLGIAAEDDDGNTASRPDDSEEEPKQEVRKPKPTPRQPKQTLPVGTETRYTVPDHVGENVEAPAETTVLVKGGDEVPPEDEKEGLRNRYELLGKDLASAGLTSKGMKQSSKRLAYLLKVTGAESAGVITRNQWNLFFDVVGRIIKGPGIKELVKLVEEAATELGGGTQ